ncbi:MAG: tyrosine-type recombinase/integrase [Actinomycetota bacterium]|nr:tyrosine-type recombinase/integrase [Actinomycetota bacterium]
MPGRPRKTLRDLVYDRTFLARKYAHLLDEEEPLGIPELDAIHEPYQRERNPERRREDELEPLKPLGLHEARHTFASLMIDAGVNAKALTTYLGHSSVEITFDRYGHLMPGNENEAAALLDAYLERANSRARMAQLEG